MNRITIFLATIVLTLSSCSSISDLDDRLTRLEARVKAIENILERQLENSQEIAKEDVKIVRSAYNLLVEKDRKKYIKDLEKRMLEYAKNLEFEKAATLRDEIEAIKKQYIS